MQNLRTVINAKPSSHFGAFSNKCTKGKKSHLKSDTITYLFSFNGKEKLDEINGAGNNLDFGARIYDARMGRWLSLDLLDSKYPDLTPYNFCVNSPLLLKDIDRKDFIPTVTNNKDGITTLNISATVYVVGASIAQVAEMNRISKEVLVNGKSGNTTKAFHESLHFLGLSDRYTEIKQKVLNPKTGKFEDKRSTIPNPGWANDVLTNLCVIGFNQTHYDNIANFFSGKTGTEEVKTKKTGFIDQDKKGKLIGKAK
jgi:RHS repeat-associated protein